MDKIVNITKIVLLLAISAALVVIALIPPKIASEPTWLRFRPATPAEIKIHEAELEADRFKIQENDLRKALEEHANETGH
jgi:hypothetical protein